MKNKSVLTGVFILFIVFLLNGCSSFDEEEFEVFIIDEENILNNNTKEWLKKLNYPRGFAFAVQAKKSIPQSIIGAEADKLFKTLANEHPQKKAF
jgi:hypothetical protein